MAEIDVKIHPSWKEVLKDEFRKPYFRALVDFLKREKAAGKIIYPPGPLIFNAFEQTPFDKVRVVILGQDPYHNPGEAMGLCFSVPKGVKMPPSLVNIFREVQRDVGCPMPPHGDLTYWAQQGVFLLNAFLTVEKNKPASHRSIGWEKFTDAVIWKLSQRKEGLIFLLWGKFARSKKPLIDQMKHYVLESAHPSPLAGNRFMNNGHFSKTNQILQKLGQPPIDWCIK